MEYKKLWHCVYYCDYHLVLVSKYRRKIFSDEILEYIKLRMKEIQEYHPLIEIKEINHDENHIHMLVSIPPKMSVGDAVRIIKLNTSRNIKNKFKFMRNLYWGTDWIWSDGYFISTVWINEQTIRKYIELQWKEDSGQVKLELG